MIGQKKNSDQSWPCSQISSKLPESELEFYVSNPDARADALNSIGINLNAKDFEQLDKPRQQSCKYLD